MSATGKRAQGTGEELIPVERSNDSRKRVQIPVTFDELEFLRSRGRPGVVARKIFADALRRERLRVLRTFVVSQVDSKGSDS